MNDEPVAVQRKVRVTVTYTDREIEAVRARAEAAGLSLLDYMRAVTLGHKNS